MAQHKFLPGNKHSVGKGRPPGSGFTTQFRSAVGKDEFQKLVLSIYDRAMSGDMQAAAILVNRLVPPLKPSAEPVRVELPAGNSAEMAKGLLAAATSGDIAPETAKTLLELVSASAALDQLQALSSRIEALEACGAQA
jgi:hypothetical protein